MVLAERVGERQEMEMYGSVKSRSNLQNVHVTAAEQKLAEKVGLKVREPIGRHGIRRQST